MCAYRDESHNLTIKEGAGGYRSASFRASSAKRVMLFGSPVDSG